MESVRPVTRIGSERLPARSTAGLYRAEFRYHNINSNQSQRSVVIVVPDGAPLSPRRGDTYLVGRRRKSQVYLEEDGSGVTRLPGPSIHPMASPEDETV